MCSTCRGASSSPVHQGRDRDALLSKRSVRGSHTPDLRIAKPYPGTSFSLPSSWASCPPLHHDSEVLRLAYPAAARTAPLAVPAAAPVAERHRLVSAGRVDPATFGASSPSAGRLNSLRPWTEEGGAPCTSGRSCISSAGYSNCDPQFWCAGWRDSAPWSLTRILQVGLTLIGLRPWDLSARLTKSSLTNL